MFLLMGMQSWASDDGEVKVGVGYLPSHVTLERWLSAECQALVMWDRHRTASFWDVT